MGEYLLTHGEVRNHRKFAPKWMDLSGGASSKREKVDREAGHDREEE
jgi:hypothetical protein